MNSESRHFDAVVPAPFGAVGIRTSAGAVSEITYLPKSARTVLPKNGLSDRAARQIERYLVDAQYRFDLPLMIGGTPFQRRVWDALIAIQVGELMTYGSVARQLCSSPRAVGQACGANRLPIVIPCHRVVGASNVGGFAHHTDGYLITTKKWLLAHEAPMRKDDLVNPGQGETAPA
jgi:methylated-DNA-[protein]-cysteine S-methyltransferase